MKERPSNLSAYFGLFKGESHPLSMLSDAKPAIDILVSEGKAIEQLTLDGDNVIYMPDVVKKNLNPCLSCPKNPKIKVNTTLMGTNSRE